MNTEKIKVQYHSELMKNYISQSPIEGGKEFKSLLDYKNNPLIFSIGSDDKLRLIYQNTNKNTPCSLVEISEKEFLVKSFDIAQDIDTKEITIVYSGIKNEVYEIHYTKFSIENENNSFSKISWNKHTIDDSIKKIDHIKITTEYLMFTSLSTSKQANYYYAKFGKENIKLNLPQVSREILDFRVGLYNKQFGAFLLYSVGDAQSLIFQSFPDEKYNKTFKVAFKFEGKLNNIDLLRKSNKTDSLVACGDNLYLFESQTNIKILIKDRQTSFSNLKVTYFNGVSSIWLVENISQNNSNLLFLTDNFYNECSHSFIKEKWTTDITMQKNVEQFTCIKGDKEGNKLFLLNNKNQLSSFTQDPKTSLWKDDLVFIDPIDDTDGIVEITCYTASITLKDNETFEPLVYKTVQMSSSSIADVTINGLCYTLSPNYPIKISSDLSGMITIIYPVEDDINTPLFYIQSEDLNLKEIINPSHKLEQRLSKIKSSDDFLNAKTDQNKPLWEKEDQPDKSDLNNSSYVIQKLLESRNNFLEKEKDQKTTTNSPINQWGITFYNNDIHYLDHQSVNKHKVYLKKQASIYQTEKGSTFINELGYAFGTLFHWIKTGIGKITSFIFEVIDGITSVIIEISGQIFKFIIDTIEQVFPFMKVIFDAISIVFKTVLQWIGKLIGWDDIWATHKVLARMFENGMKSNINNIDNNINIWRENIDKIFGNIKDEFHKIGLENIPEIDFENQKKKAYSSKEYEYINSPNSNWSSYQLQHGGIMTNEKDDDIKVLYEMINLDLIKTPLIDEHLNKLLSLNKNSIISLHGLIEIISPIFDTIIDTIKGFVDRILDFIIAILEKTEDILTKKVKIPFLAPFYKLITKLLGDEEELTFINAVSLLISIPYVSTLKLMGKGAPFEDGTHGIDEIDIYNQLLNPKQYIPVYKSSTQNSNTHDEIFYYNRIGGTIGSFSGMIASIVNVFSPKWGLLFSLFSQISTIPIPADDSKSAQDAQSIRMSQFLISFISTITTSKMGDKKAASVIGFCISILTLSLNISANVIKNPGMMSWVLHMSSRSSSIIGGVGNFTKNPEIIVAAVGLSFLSNVTNFILSLNKDFQMEDYSEQNTKSEEYSHEIIIHGTLVGV